MGTLYIPPENVCFKLEGFKTKKWMIEGEKVKMYCGHTYSDQYWKLVPGTGEYKGHFQIVAQKTGKRMYPRKGKVKMYGGHTYSDQYWKLVPGTGEYEGYFQIFNYKWKSNCIIERDEVATYVGPTYSDQYWKFIFEDMEVVDVTYNLDKAKIIQKTPDVIAKQTNENKTNTNQTMEFRFSKGIDHTSSFEHSHGFSVKVGSEFKAGIPFIQESKISVEVCQENSWTIGKSKTISKRYEANVPAVAKPHTEVVARAYVQHAKLRVPYEMILRSKMNNVEVKSYGVWSGVTTWDLQCKFTERVLSHSKGDHIEI